MGLDQFKKKYPQYNDWDDQDLANALYEKYGESNGVDRDSFMVDIGRAQYSSFAPEKDEAAVRRAGNLTLETQEASIIPEPPGYQIKEPESEKRTFNDTSFLGEDYIHYTPLEIARGQIKETGDAAKAMGLHKLERAATLSFQQQQNQIDYSKHRRALSGPSHILDEQDIQAAINVGEVDLARAAVRDAQMQYGVAEEARKQEEERSKPLDATFANYWKEGSKSVVRGISDYMRGLAASSMRQYIKSGGDPMSPAYQRMKEAYRNDPIIQEGTKEKWQPSNLKRVGGLKQVFLDAWMSAPGMAMQAAVTAAGGPLAGGMAMTAHIGGLNYREMIDNGVDPQEAFAASTLSGSLQASMEQLGLHGMFNAWKLSGKGWKAFTKKMAESTAPEALTEFLQEYPDQIITAYNINRAKGMSKQAAFNAVMDELPAITEAAAYSGLIGGVMGLGLGGGAHISKETYGILEDQLTKKLERDLYLGISQQDPELVAKIKKAIEQLEAIKEDEETPLPEKTKQVVELLDPRLAREAETRQLFGDQLETPGGPRTAPMRTEPSVPQPDEMLVEPQFDQTEPELPDLPYLRGKDDQILIAESEKDAIAAIKQHQNVPAHTRTAMPVTGPDGVVRIVDKTKIKPGTVLIDTTDATKAQASNARRIESLLNKRDADGKRVWKFGYLLDTIEALGIPLEYSYAKPGDINNHWAVFRRPEEHNGNRFRIIINRNRLGNFHRQQMNIAHEMLHAIIQHQVWDKGNGWKFVSDLTRAWQGVDVNHIKALQKRIRNKYNKTKDDSIISDTLGNLLYMLESAKEAGAQHTVAKSLGRAEELVTVMFTNPKAAKVLKSLKVKHPTTSWIKNAWDSFVYQVSKAIGRDNTQSMFDEVKTIMSAYMDESAVAPKKKPEPKPKPTPKPKPAPKKKGYKVAHVDKIYKKIAQDLVDAYPHLLNNPELHKKLEEGIRVLYRVHNREATPHRTAVEGEAALMKELGASEFARRRFFINEKGKKTRWYTESDIKNFERFVELAKDPDLKDFMMELNHELKKNIPQERSTPSGYETSVIDGEVIDHPPGWISPQLMQKAKEVEDELTLKWSKMYKLPKKQIRTFARGVAHGMMTEQKAMAELESAHEKANPPKPKKVPKKAPKKPPEKKPEPPPAPKKVEPKKAPPKKKTPKETPLKPPIELTSEQQSRAIEEAKGEAEATGPSRQITITPGDFIKLTTGTDQTAERVRSKTTSKYMETFNPEEWAKATAPYLVVDENGKVLAHEGRHRAAMYERMGIKKFPVLLIGKDGNINPDSMSKLESQKFGSKDRKFVRKIATKKQATASKAVKDNLDIAEHIGDEKWLMQQWSNLSTKMTMAKEEGDTKAYEKYSRRLELVKAALFGGATPGDPGTYGGWHGSGVLWSPMRADLSYALTGEGALVFGWGFYLSEAQNVGKSYAEQQAYIMKILNTSRETGTSWRTIDGMQEIMDTELHDIVWGDTIQDDYEMPDIDLEDRLADIYQDPIRRKMITRKAAKYLTAMLKNEFGSKENVVLSTIGLLKSHSRIQDIINNNKELRQEKYGQEIAYIMDSWISNSFMSSLLEQQSPEGKRHLYELLVHDGKDPSQYTYISWDKNIPRKLRETASPYVAEGEALFPGVDVLEQKYVKPSAQHLTREERTQISMLLDAVETGKELYQEIAKVFWFSKDYVVDYGEDSMIGWNLAQRDASMYLLGQGIDGIDFPIGSMRGGYRGTKRNKVVFDDKEIKVVSHEAYNSIPEKNKPSGGRPDQLGLEFTRQREAELNDAAPGYDFRLEGWYPKASGFSPHGYYFHVSNPDNVLHRASFVHMFDTINPEVLRKQIADREEVFRAAREAKPSDPANFTYQDQQMEEDHQKYRVGVAKDSYMSKVADFLVAAKNKFREFEHISSNKLGEYAEVTKELRKLRNYRGVASAKAVGKLTKILEGMNRDQYEVFERMASMADLWEQTKLNEQRVAAGETPIAIPNDWDPDSIDIEMKRLMGAIMNNPTLKKAWKARMDTWEALRSEYSDAMAAAGFNVKDRMQRLLYFRHQVVDYLKAKGPSTISTRKLATPTRRSHLRTRKGTKRPINLNYIQAEYEVMAQLLYDIQIGKTVGLVKSEFDIKPQLQIEQGEQELENYEIPEGYVAWRPQEGSVMYLADTIPAKLVAGMIKKGLKSLKVKESQISKVLAVGRKHSEMVIPEDLAATLDSYLDLPKRKLMGRFFRGLMTGWKAWQLVSPFRFSKYNLRNLTGDAEAVFVGGQTLATGRQMFGKAGKDIIMRLLGKETSQDYKDWVDRGGLESNFTTQEMADILRSPEFEHLGKDKKSRVGKFARAVFKGPRTLTDAREQWMRYASYLAFLKKLDSGTFKDSDYAASIPQEINTLRDNKDKAFMLSNDLLGAYDRVTVAGDWFRRHVMPFYSFQEVNATRTMQIFRNMRDNDKLVGSIGRKILGKTAAKSAMLALATGRIAVTMMFWSTLLQVFNNLEYPEEEAALTDELRETPHIYMGPPGSETIRYFPRVGILGDLLEWGNLQSAPLKLADLLTGHTSWKDVKEDLNKYTTTDGIFDATGELTKQLGKKIVGMVGPQFKVPFELHTRQSLFPDSTNPQPITDWRAHIADQMLPREVGNLIRQKPMAKKWVSDMWESLYTYKKDKTLMAYNATKARKLEWLRDMGFRGRGYHTSEKATAAYYMSLAYRYGDTAAFQKHLVDYIKLSNGKIKSIKSIVKELDPLYGMTKEQKLLFVSGLDKNELKGLELAYKHYAELRMGVQFTGGKDD